MYSLSVNYAQLNLNILSR